MEAKGKTFLKVLCNRFHKAQVDALFKPLANNELKESVLANPCVSQDVQAIVESPESQLASIHYSWISPLIQKMSVQKQAWTCGVLPEKQAFGVQKTAHIEPVDLHWIPGIKDRLQSDLLQELTGSNMIPMAYLPETELFPLLKLDKDHLVKIIECLGVYDLAEEMRKIVDRDRLKIIYSALNENEQHFLRKCLHHKNRLPSLGMDLNKWSGSATDLKMQLHRRGIARLGRGLSGQHPQFIWKIVHILDKGRGELVEKWITPEPKGNITQLLVGQILNVMNFLQKSAT